MILTAACKIRGGAARHLARIAYRKVWLTDQTCWPRFHTRRVRPSSTCFDNKGEARNAFARAVFFNRQGDLRGRSFEKPALPRQRPQPARCRRHSLEDSVPGTRRLCPARAWHRHRGRIPDSSRVEPPYLPVAGERG